MLEHIENSNDSIQELYNDLMSFLDEEEKKDLGITSEQETYIDSKETANYYIGKIKQLQAEIIETEELGKRELEKQTERINKWVKSSTSSKKFIVDKYTEMLRDFWLKEGNNKTLKLSQGSLCMRKCKDKKIFDDDAVLKFLKDKAEDYIVEIPTIDKSKLKEDMLIDNGAAYLSVNGQLVKIEGIEVVNQGSKFEVK